MAVVAVPSSLAMGELAGLPVVFGLYATFLPLVGYAVFGSSRHLVVGPDATMATLTAAIVAPMAIVDGTADPARYAALAAALALTMGVILILAGTLRLGFIADFFGKPVLLGYINGIALTIIAGQLGKMFGLDIDADDFFPIVREFVTELDETSGATLLLSAGLLLPALLVRRFARIVPAPVVVLLLGLLLGSLLDVDDLDIAVVGDVQQGLPAARASGHRARRLHRSPSSGGRTRADRVRRRHRHRPHVRAQARLRRRPERRASWLRGGQRPRGRLERAAGVGKRIEDGGQRRLRRTNSGHGADRGRRRRALPAVPHASHRAATQGRPRRHRGGRGARALQHPLGLEAPPGPTRRGGTCDRRVRRSARVRGRRRHRGRDRPFDRRLPVPRGEAARCRSRQGRGRGRVPRHRALGGRSRRVPA